MEKHLRLEWTKYPNVLIVLRLASLWKFLHGLSERRHTAGEVIRFVSCDGKLYMAENEGIIETGRLGVVFSGFGEPPHYEVYYKLCQLRIFY